MLNTPFLTYSVPGKFITSIFPVLVAFCLLGNNVKHPGFLHIDFLFNSIFAVPALQFSRTGSGNQAAFFLSPESSTNAREDVFLSNSSESWKSSGTILLVDDEDSILLAMSYMLNKR